MKFNTHLVQATITTPLGSMVLAASNAGLSGAWFAGQRHAPDFSAWPSVPVASPSGETPTGNTAQAVLFNAAQQLQEYFSGQRQVFDVPLDLGHGTPFQQQVWQALRAIPAGHTSTYGELAALLQRPQASRAVGAAVGRNPISILVPCHRVLGAKGKLTGYAGGLDKKMALLNIESAH